MENLLSVLTMENLLLVLVAIIELSLLVGMVKVIIHRKRIIKAMIRIIGRTGRRIKKQITSI